MKAAYGACEDVPLGLSVSFSLEKPVAQLKLRLGILSLFFFLGNRSRRNKPIPIWTSWNFSMWLARTRERPWCLGKPLHIWCLWPSISWLAFGISPLKVALATNVFAFCLELNTSTDSRSQKAFVNRTKSSKVVLGASMSVWGRVGSIWYDLKMCFALLGPPVVPFYPFWGEGSPTKIDCRRKSCTLTSKLSNLEDLAFLTIGILLFR